MLIGVTHKAINPTETSKNAQSPSVYPMMGSINLIQLSLVNVGHPILVSSFPNKSPINTSANPIPFSSPLNKRQLIFPQFLANLQPYIRHFTIFPVLFTLLPLFISFLLSSPSAFPLCTKNEDTKKQRKS